MYEASVTSKITFKFKYNKSLYSQFGSQLMHLNISSESLLLCFGLIPATDLRSPYLFNALHPVLDVFEGLLVCDVVHQDNALTRSANRWGQGDRTLWLSQKAQGEHKEAAMPSWLSSLLVLLASCSHHGSSVVRCCDGLKPLLPRCVPAQSTCVKIRSCFSQKDGGQMSWVVGDAAVTSGLLEIWTI